MQKQRTKSCATAFLKFLFLEETEFGKIYPVISFLSAHFFIRRRSDREPAAELAGVDAAREDGVRSVSARSGRTDAGEERAQADRGHAAR